AAGSAHLTVSDGETRRIRSSCASLKGMVTSTLSMASAILAERGRTISPGNGGRCMEEILEPQRPICDPHHHLWDHPGRRYLIDELLADTGSGHNVTSTVFVECMSMYRADGPAA